MAKIGRNEKCPCQSGKKYKHCCGNAPRDAVKARIEEQDSRALTLMNAVQTLQDICCRKERASWELGVFFLYSTEDGDGWLMEMTDCDCVQVAAGGEILPPPIDESSDTIEVNWSHMYRIHKKQLVLTAYDNKIATILANAPTGKINAAMRRIRKKYSPAELQNVHVSDKNSSIKE